MWQRESRRSGRRTLAFRVPPKKGTPDRRLRPDECTCTLSRKFFLTLVQVVVPLVLALVSMLVACSQNY